MKVYRLFKGFAGDGQIGYAFYATKRAAEADLKAMREAGNGEIGERPEIETLDSGKGREGLVSLLNRFASHPDNG